MRLRMTIPAMAVGLTAAALALGAPAAQAAGAANMQNALFAGYAAGPGSTGTTSAGVTFKVPAISGCTATASAASSGAAVATTTKKLYAAGIVLSCTSGKPAYEGVETINSMTTKLAVTVKAGDTIVVTASLSATKSSVTFADGTHKFSKTGGGAAALYALDGMGAVPIKTGSTTNFPIPNFGKVTYTGGMLNGKTPHALPGAAVDMYVKPITKIVTSALGTGGATWTDTWKHA